jgi:hypothetical protein
MSGKKSPAKEPEPVSSPVAQADGRQPFMPRMSHDPCLLMLPFRFAQAMRMRPLSVGRLTTPFIQRCNHNAMIWLVCTEFSSKDFSRK